MGKEGELWDDSALINAFDNAISTYKKMHKGKNKESSAEGESKMGTSSTEDNVSNAEFGVFGTAKDADEKSNIAATGAPDLDETSCVTKLEQNHHVDPTCLVSSGQGIQSQHNGYAYAQNVDDYYIQLVAEYNELEEKRLKIWEQINQYGGWNHQYAATANGSGIQYPNAQDYSMSAYQVTDPNAVCTCCPCFSQCLQSSCTSVPVCSLGGSCVAKSCNHHSVERDDKISLPCEDGKIHKMAMGAAERALSTIRTTISSDSNVNEENEKKNFEPGQVNGSETDLTAVLNAWYSAGFHTGKYLVEQSVGNRRHK